MLHSDEYASHFSFNWPVWVWQLPGECLLPECAVPVTRRRGGGMLLWLFSDSTVWAVLVCCMAT